MNLYVVTRKSDGAEVNRYNADAPVEWTGFEFATHDHTLVHVPTAPEPGERPEDWYINIGPFFDRFQPYKIPILASADLVVQAIIKDSTVRKYIDLKGRRAELVQAVALIQSKGFPISAAAVLDVKPSETEVYRG